MVLFKRVHGKVCQNDEVSPDVHTYVHAAKGAQIPHTDGSKLPTVGAPHLLSAVPSLGNLIELGSIRKLGTFRVLRSKGMRHVGGPF